MADVTDIAFRQIISKYSNHGKIGGGPDVFWTEFVSADGLANKIGRKKLIKNLNFSKKEKPIIAQLFGANPEKMRVASKIVAELGFDGIDINMGCPDRKVEKQGAGASLMKNPNLAVEIIRSAILGIKDAKKKIPVSVKTRLGFNKNEIESWIPFLAKEKISAITIHGRTRKELSLVPARWEDISRASKIVKKINPEIIVIGNGDVFDLKDAREKAKKYDLDGVMIGRGIFGKPWLFSDSQKFEKNENKKVIKEKLKILVEHTKLFEKLLVKEKIKNFDVMKKHFKAYVSGFLGAKELRIELMATKNAKEVERVVKSFLNL